MTLALNIPTRESVDLASEWVYFKLYLASATDRMDQVITLLRHDIHRHAATNDWFFIRYFDEGGVHLRVRVNSHGLDKRTLDLNIDSVCRRLLNGVSQLLGSNYNPMVFPLSWTGADDPPRESKLRVAPAIYEPEYEKFGGTKGINIAHPLFTQSSELACGVLEQELTGRCSRKTLAPLLMYQVYETFLAHGNLPSFWKEYAMFWLRGDTPAAQDYRALFCRKGQELADAGVALFARPADISEASTRLVSDWRKAVAYAFTQYATLGILTQLSPALLCSHFIHLMNNRLGFTSLEEAYLATLIEQQLGEA